MRWYEALVMLFAACGRHRSLGCGVGDEAGPEAQILLDLLNDYATPEMAEALRTLRSWQEQHGDEFADNWELGMATSDANADAVDHARRRVSAYVQNVDELWQNRLISRNTARAAVDKAGLAVLTNVCDPLERRLNPRVNLGFMRRLRALCPHRRDLMFAIPFQRLE